MAQACKRPERLHELAGRGARGRAREVLGKALGRRQEEGAVAAAAVAVVAVAAIGAATIANGLADERERARARGELLRRQQRRALVERRAQRLEEAALGRDARLGDGRQQRDDRGGRRGAQLVARAVERGLGEARVDERAGARERGEHRGGRFEAERAAAVVARAQLVLRRLQQAQRRARAGARERREQRRDRRRLGAAQQHARLLLDRAPPRVVGRLAERREVLDNVRQQREAAAARDRRRPRLEERAEHERARFVLLPLAPLLLVVAAAVRGRRHELAVAGAERRQPRGLAHGDARPAGRTPQ